jgi:AraC-like DNA-binding protein
MPEGQRRLVSLFTELMPLETLLTTSVPGLCLFRIDESFPRAPYSYCPEIIIMAQGEKRVYLGTDFYAYGPSRYLVLPVPLPAECEGSAEPGRPILGLTISIDPVEVGEILLDMEYHQSESPALPRGIYSAPMSEALTDATERLLRAIADPQDCKVLAPLIKKEIIYRVLQGEKGEILQAIAHRDRRFFQIAKVLRKIHASYSAEFNIERLARELDMSSSTFHSSFKAVTDTSPLQYIKNVRLHKARTLMLQDGLTAGIAALRVGYESASQFSREYKRLFGSTPATDAAVSRGRSRVNPAV